MMTSKNLIRTGISGLDSILMGGIPRTNVILVEGPTGKAKENQLRISSKARVILLVNRPDSTAIAGCGVKVKPCRKPVIFPGKH